MKSLLTKAILVFPASVSIEAAAAIAASIAKEYNCQVEFLFELNKAAKG
jgi:hypothetical protein